MQNQVKKIDVSGGPAQTLGTLPTGAVGSGSWNRDGTIIVGGRPGPLWKISQAGGVPAAITSLDTARGETIHSLPVFMPDGRHFIYFRRGRQEVTGIYGASLDDKPGKQSATRILANEFAAAYANGYLFFMREGTLMAQPFDAARLQLRGEPVPVVERMATFGSTGVFSVSPAAPWLTAPRWRARPFSLPGSTSRVRSLAPSANPVPIRWLRFRRTERAPLSAMLP